MGRVKRYKKTKSFDPFFEGKKEDPTTKTRKKGKIPKKDEIVEEQKMPKTMKSLLERVKLMKTKKKLKRLDSVDKTQVKTKKPTGFQKKKGENTREYFHRIDRETATAVVQSLKSNQKMSERRKSHLKKRKEKEKVKKNPERALVTIDFSDLKDEIKFGDVVSAPPNLTFKPRKAPQNKGAKSLLLNSKLPKETVSEQTTTKPEKTNTKLPESKSKRRKHMTEYEKAAMDKERMRVIEAYRIAKKTTPINFPLQHE